MSQPATIQGNALRIQATRFHPDESVESVAAELTALQTSILAAIDVAADWQATDAMLRPRTVDSAQTLAELIEQWELPWLGARRPNDSSHRIRIIASAGEATVVDYQLRLSVDMVEGSTVSAELDLLLVAPTAQHDPRDVELLKIVVDAFAAQHAALTHSDWPTASTRRATDPAVGELTYVATRGMPDEVPRPLIVGAFASGWILQVPRQADTLLETDILAAYRVLGHSEP